MSYLDKRYLSRVSVIIILIGLASFFASQTFLLSHNSLYKNGRWIVTKILLRRAVGGAYGFLGSSNSLAGNCLDLSKWQGFQEVIYKQAIDVQEVKFNFLLDENSYLFFVFNKDRDGFSGIRISLNNIFKNIYFTSKDSGKFVTVHYISLPRPYPKHWNQCRVIFKDNTFSLYINDTFIGEFQAKLLKNQYIGFRGGLDKAMVDRIIIRPKNSSRIIHENFNNTNISIFFICLLIILIVNALIALFFHAMNTDIMLRIIFRLIGFDTFLVILSFFIFNIYYFYLSPRYPKWGSFTNTMPREFNIAEGNYWKNASPDFICKNIIDKYMNENVKNVFRILFIGSSQTWGAGTSEESKTFVSAIEEKLNGLPDNHIQYECINTGISGLDSSQLLDLYIKEWIKLAPKIAVINLSINDKDIDTFSANLDKFIQFNNSRGIKTILVLEANSIEHVPGSTANHEVMRKVGEKNGVRIVDMHKYLKENYDQGILWWDVMHLTDFGQELIAGHLFQILCQEIGGRY